MAVFLIKLQKWTKTSDCDALTFIFLIPDWFVNIINSDLTRIQFPSVWTRIFWHPQPNKTFWRFFFKKIPAKWQTAFQPWFESILLTNAECSLQDFRSEKLAFLRFLNMPDSLFTYTLNFSVCAGNQSQIIGNAWQWKNSAWFILSFRKLHIWHNDEINFIPEGIIISEIFGTIFLIPFSLKTQGIFVIFLSIPLTFAGNNSKQ